MVKKVEELLGSSNLNVASEEDTYYAAISWVKHDQEQRIQFLSQVNHNC